MKILRIFYFGAKVQAIEHAVEVLLVDFHIITYNEGKG